MSTITSHRRRRLGLRIAVTLIALAIVAGAVFLLALQQIAPPIPLGTPSGEIAFASNRDGNWDIFTMDAAGAVTNLTADATKPQMDDWFAAWAMDGGALFFLSDRTGESGPAIMQPDGSDQQALTIFTAITVLVGEGRVDWDPVWSPDGKHIAWSSLRDLNLEIYVMDADGENRTRLTNDFGYDWYPAWSPDGTRIAYASEHDGALNVYVMNAAGGDPHPLTTHPARELRPVWSRDGAQILFVTEREQLIADGTLDLWLVDAEGDPNPRRLADNVIFEGGLSWSPDGSQVAYMSNRDGDWNVYVMDADGDNVRRVTESAADEMFPAWRP